MIKNFNLKPFNTFGLNARAKYFTEYSSVEDLQNALSAEIVRNHKTLAVGCGSNLLFLNDFDGIVLHSRIDFINVLNKNENDVILEAGSGVVWDDFVRFCVEKNFYGAENLSLIPGQTGAAAVQNIGAYGVEIQDIIEKVNVVDIATGKQRIFTNAECEYDYRSSIFKTKEKGRYIVTSVVLRLSKKEKYSLDYQHLKQKVEKRGIISLHNVRNTIIDIRRQKLPDYHTLGNAGSFFKNPYCCAAHFEHLKTEFPDIPYYPVNEEVVKLSAAWLIEQSGCKGKIFGGAQIYEKQPLVIINLGNATASEITALAEQVQCAVFEKFKVRLEREVNYI
ncbi:MAG: UDP-N-acetylmuramate dehydrogenase [Paludibacter sp.]|jgi:UDP-N-acetylmuramate dehydrogenase|nr:UDP-N-acetylmuramate dehydrogenase [Paludibacter sp.]